MTTKDSPLAKLRAQAENIAKHLKATERGEVADPTGKLAASLAKGEILFGIAMDDKLVQVTMPWKIVRETSEAALAEFIIAQMREERPQA
jgi:hypothetical protein